MHNSLGYWWLWSSQSLSDSVNIIFHVEQTRLRDRNWIHIPIIQVLIDTTCLGSNPACQMSVPSSQLLIIGKKQEGNQGKDKCKSSFLLWGAGRGRLLMWNKICISRLQHFLQNWLSVLRVLHPMELQGLSVSFQSKPCLKLAVGVIIDNRCCDSFLRMPHVATQIYASMV